MSRKITNHKVTIHRDLDHSVFVSPFHNVVFVLIMYCTLSYVGSRDLVRQWPAVHYQNKQRFLNETFKSRCNLLLYADRIFV